MDLRLNLHEKLKKAYTKATKKSSDSKVWFQPSKNTRLSYPCIIYKLTDIPVNSANNFPYKIDHCYELTVIDSDPLSPLREEIVRMFTCKLVRVYENDNLYHYVYHIFD